MARMIFIDLKKLFGDKRIYICMLGLGCLYLMAYAEQINGQGAYVGDFASGLNMVLTNEMMLLCFLLCIVGGSFLYCSEEKHGYVLFEVKRVGLPVFTVSKLVVSVLGGFLTAVAGIAMSAIGIIFILYAKYGEWTKVMADSATLEACVWEWLSLALLCGLLSAVGFVVTTFVANYYIGMTVPILFYYALLTLYIWIPMPSILKISTVFFRIGVAEGNYGAYFIYEILYTICYLVLFYSVAKYRIGRRLEHA